MEVFMSRNYPWPLTLALLTSTSLVLVQPAASAPRSQGNFANSSTYFSCEDRFLPRTRDEDNCQDRVRDAFGSGADRSGGGSSDNGGGGKGGGGGNGGGGGGGG